MPGLTIAMGKRTPNGSNVFLGEDSLVQFHDPDCHPPLPLVELPRRLNPFRDDGVRVYAKMMTFLPAHNVKALPALNMLQSESGLVKPETKTIVEYSSGSTVISMAMMSRILHGIDDVHAYLSNKTSSVKLRLMQFFGLQITLFGGPSQPEPTDPRGGIQRAITQGRYNPEIANPNQYENDNNYKAHMRWTGPQILRQIPDIDVFAAGLGTSGTMTGIGTYLKQRKPSITRVGVCTAPGDRVPGPRSFALLDPVQFPWRAAVDCIEEVGSKDSFQLSMNLSREGIVCGPSSGFNLQGLFNYLTKRKRDGSLKELSTRADGEIHCVFICCDLPFQYIDEYFSHLGEEAFPKMQNENLLEVDKHRYDDRWELTSDAFLSKMYPSVASNASGPTILDLRNNSAATKLPHLPGAIPWAVQSLEKDQVSPFHDSVLLERQWRELDRVLPLATPTTDEHGQLVLQELKGRVVGCVDYSGDTARIATSILRARGVEAWSLKYGMESLAGVDVDGLVTPTATSGNTVTVVREVEAAL